MDFVLEILAGYLFFWRSPDFGQKNRLHLCENQPKYGSTSFDVVSSLRNTPLPPKQIPGTLLQIHGS